MNTILTKERRSALNGLISDWISERDPEGRVLDTLDYLDVDKIDQLIDEAIAPAMADAVVCAIAALAPSDAVGAPPTSWQTGAPPVPEGKCWEYIIAVRRAQSNPPGKVAVFSANYANKFTDDGCLSDRSGDEFIADGWYVCGLDMSGEYNEVYEPIGLNEGDEIVGWQALPKWSDAAPVAPAAPFDMLAHLQRQREFSGRTFGPGARTKGVCDHIRKELSEIESNPADLTEWIDVVILALDGAWRVGGSPQQIIDALVAKQTKNEGRVWPDWRTVDPNKAIEHDRSHDTVAPAAVASTNERAALKRAMDLLDAKLGDTDPNIEGMTQDEVDATYPVLSAMQILSGLYCATPTPTVTADAVAPLFTRAQADAAVDDFEIVGDNNLSRDPTDEEKFVLHEFVARLFEDVPQTEAPKVGDVTGLYLDAQSLSKAAWVKKTENVLNSVLAHAWDSTRAGGPAAQPDERAAFEEYMRTGALDAIPDLTRDDLGSYDDWDTQRTWRGWQAHAVSQAMVRPIGYLAPYEVSRLESGHDANLRSAKFGPGKLDGDIPVFTCAAAPQAGALTDEHRLSDAVPEGCTPADARKLREANHRLADENHQQARTIAFLRDQNRRIIEAAGRIRDSAAHDRKDAARYRWLRERAWYVDAATHALELRERWRAGDEPPPDSGDIEQALDGARKAEIECIDRAGGEA
jgi:hypothetical protein